MILTPLNQPPPLRSAPVEQPHAPSHSSHVRRVDTAASTTARTDFDTTIQDIHPEGHFLELLKVPTVVLDTPSISHTMAAALSLSLLGHTLFLKSQIPFPVAQLSRMPGGKSSNKAAKKRDDLLATFDTLASHLHTTFVTLATAYAECKSTKVKTEPSAENALVPGSHTSKTREARRGTAHLMFVLGASPGAARARILLTIDGLEVKVWGERAFEAGKEAAQEAVVGCDGEEAISDEQDDEQDRGTEDEESDEDCEGDDSDEDEEANDGESESGSEPPPSRSPSPFTPPTRSLAPSPESLPSPPTLPTPAPLPHEALYGDATPNSPNSPKPTTSAFKSDLSKQAIPLAPPPSRVPEQPTITPSREATPTPSYAEEQQALRAAERLLSRTLMNAWVDGEGDMSSELAPTQTHIFLRAPRRFVHPAWAARQNLTRTLDSIMDGFLKDAGAVPAPPVSKGKVKSRGGVRTEGAWIGCRGGSAFAAATGKCADEKTGKMLKTDEDEEDEEIWWAWEGKLVGFAEW